MSKIVLITGGSSGIGKSVGEFLIQKGFIVYGTSRSPEKYPDSKFPIVALDVTKKDSISGAISYVLSKEGHIDVLINNAGVGITGPIEEIPESEIKNNFETNLFGPINVIKARSEEHTSELQSRPHLVCRLLLEKKNIIK